MTFIDADDDVVSDLLASTLELLAESGGWLHPDATVVARDGQLSLECTADDDEPLLVIPRESFVRVDAMTWGDDPLTMTISALPDDLGDIETSMAYVQAALHNQTGKLEWLRRTHPALAPLPEAIVDRMRHLVPGFRATEMTPIDVLFSDRCLRVDLGDGRGSQRVLVPILDLLNHHPRGAQAQWHDQAFSVAAARSFGGSECALDYGHGRDAMELAAIYGFADTAATVAHSATVTCEIPSTGPVVVTASGRTVTGEFPALVVENRPDSIHLSHLSFDSEGMDGLVESLSARLGHDTRSIADVLAGVAEENIALLEALVTAGVQDSPAAQVLADAAAHQVRVLHECISDLRRP